MRILNVMLGRHLGGLEKAAFDYAYTLTKAGHDVITVLQKKATTKELYVAHALKTHFVNPLIKSAPLTKRKLQKFATDNQIEVVINHGRYAAKTTHLIALPHIGVTHSHNLERFPQMDFIFATTKALMKDAMQNGYTQKNTFLIPNMLPHLPPQTSYIPKKPIHIGAMGRMIPRKGFDDFIEALKLLQEWNVPFRAFLAGTGPLEKKLRQQAGNLPLSFLGWVSRETYYEKVDICVVPSHQEPFGLVVLEAWGNGKPLIATRAEGPEELISDKKDGLLTPIKAPESLASALRTLIEDVDLQHQLRQEGYKTIRYFTPDTIGTRMTTALQKIYAAQK